MPNYVDDDTIYLVNGTGSFIVGGPHGDAGCTGRKIIVDTYGGVGRHGGGAFSGKDPSKVDRSAAYMARKLAKTIVGNEFATKAEVQLAYCIGVAEPVSVFVNTLGTAKSGCDDVALSKLIQSKYDLRPAAIISRLGLKTVKYLPTATYGHFGWSAYPWEEIDSL
jgi:S-adenosylmethionine synthetase